MKDFTRPRGRLRSLPAPARVVYSVFLAFTLLALAMTGWLAQDMLGADLSRIGGYYSGRALTSTEPSTVGAADGPVIELPPGVGLATEPMPLRKLLEVTHFHLFSMPIYLLVLSHLFMLSRRADATKIAWITLGTVSVSGHIAAPWLARAGSAGASAAYAVTGALMTLSFLVMSLVPLWEMWAPDERPHPAPE